MHKYRDSKVDIPVSITKGMTIESPAFVVEDEAYFVMIQSEKGHVPFSDQKCFMGLQDGTDHKDCKTEPVLEVAWTVREAENVVAEGTSSGWGPAEFTDKYLFKFVGKFSGQANKKYVVEARFGNDAPELNKTNPHLIVISVRKH